MLAFEICPLGSASVSSEIVRVREFGTEMEKPDGMGVWWDLVANRVVGEEFRVCVFVFWKEATMR